MRHLNEVFAASCGMQHRTDGTVHSIAPQFGPAATGLSVSVASVPSSAPELKP